MTNAIRPRLVERSLGERLRVMPAVVVTGARQTGKSTLARELTPGTRRYLSLDDLDVVDTARRDPEALVGGTTPVTIDEGSARAPTAPRGQARHRSRTPAGPFPADRLSQPAADAAGVGVAGRSCELPDPLAHDAARAARPGEWRNLGAVAGDPGPTVARAGGGPAKRAGGLEVPCPAGRTADARVAPQDTPPASHLVRRVRAHLHGARSARSVVDSRAAGLQAPHAGSLPAAGSDRQPDRTRAGRGPPRNRRFIATSTCWRPLICLCECRPTL